MLGSTLSCILSALLLLATSAHAATDIASYVGSDGVVHADQALMDQIFSGTRDYTTALLLTAESDRIPCDFCKILGASFRLLASSHNTQVGPLTANRDLYFVLADVDAAQETFRTLGLTHVPNLVFYPPTKSRGDAKLGLHGKHAFTSFMSNEDPTSYLEGVFRNHGHEIKVLRAFPWVRFAKLVATLVLGGIVVVVFRAQVLRVWQAKKIWMALSLMSIVMFISGHMFNVTRGTPFMGSDGANVVMVAPDFSSQLAVETQILATLYATLAFTTIGLIKFVPKLSSPYMQTVGAIGGSIAIAVAYSVLLETFKIKNGYYPFWLLPIRLF